MASSDLYAEVIVDIPGLSALDYRVPPEMMLAPGDIVMVPVGRQSKPGVVAALRPWAEVERGRLRSVSSVRFGIPPLSSEWLAITKFVGSYYCRSWGSAALAAIPQFFRKKPGVRYEKTLSKFRSAEKTASDPAPRLVLNEEQSAAAEAVDPDAGFKPWVLFGVTGSGKTEVYLRIMEKALARGPENQVLLLVPEINLTPQLEHRVRSFFPEETVVTLNSDLSEGRRAESWLAVHEGRARILVGTRMASLASFRKLSLIIVDEEHDLSYKAGDGARYSARDVSVKRAQNSGIPVVLGSATPSLESWSKVKSGRYGLLRLSRRAVSHAALPALSTADIRQKPKEEIFSPEAVCAVNETLGRGGQVLFYLNRRGFSPVLMCPACGWISSCPHCSAHMVYHKDLGRMVCHHCGHSVRVPGRCPECGAADIIPVGSGTQRIEEEIGKKWPEARVMRIDRDALRNKGDTERAFRAVHEGRVDILVGTQMIAKGHDFKRVALVVIMNADSQLVSSDIRARERVFASMLQVSGRAGRAGLPGRVIVETAFPLDPVFAYLARQDYEGFADALLEERRENGAPPFVLQALVTAEHEDLQAALAALAECVRRGLEIVRRRPETAGTVIYDPVPMSMVKIANKNRAQLLVEAPDHRTMRAFLGLFSQALPEFSGGALTLEVDPLRY